MVDKINAKIDEMMRGTSWRKDCQLRSVFDLGRIQERDIQLKTRLARVLDATDDFSTYKRAFVLRLIRGIIELVLDSWERAISFLDDSDFLYIVESYVPIEDKNLLKATKWWLSMPLARFLSCEEEKRPEFLDKDFFFSGRLRVWFTKRIHRYSNRNAQLMYSFLQLKRTCEAADSQFILKSFESHKEKLSRKMELPPAWYQEQFKYRLEYLLRYWPETFRSLAQVEECSPSASYNYVRKDGGANREIYDLSKNLDSPSLDVKHLEDVMLLLAELDLGVPELADSCETRVGAKMLAEKLVENERETMERKSREEIKLTDDLIKMGDDPCKNCVFEIRGLCPPTFSKLLELAKVDEPLHCRVASVLEPLKVRLVTAGPAVEYTVARPMQKAMWAFLKRFWQFELIGRPIDVEKFPEFRRVLLARSMRFTDEELLFLSGDYSAATDNLSIHLTKMVFEAILDETVKNSMCDNIDLDVLKLLKVYRSVLYEHQIEYPVLKVGEEKVQVESFLQQNGQLMGSILSFPILCIVNFINFWIAYDRDSTIVTPLDKVPCLVNGDDILAYISRREYANWVQTLPFAGFELSIGKNYYQKDFVMINSQLFRYNYQENSFRYLPYYNVALLFNIKKVQGKDTLEGRPKSIGDYFEIILRGSHNRLRTVRRFIHYNRQYIEKMTNKGMFNLFIDSYLGGVGCQLVDGLEVKITRFQHALAAHLIKLPLGDHKILGIENSDPHCTQSSYKITNKDNFTPHLFSIEEANIRIECDLDPDIREMTVTSPYAVPMCADFDLNYKKNYFALVRDLHKKGKWEIEGSYYIDPLCHRKLLYTSWL